jgi:hypothetical protein
MGVMPFLHLICLSGVECMKLTYIGFDIVCLPACSNTEKTLTDFNEIWYGNYPITNYTKLVITDARTCEVGVTLLIYCSEMIYGNRSFKNMQLFL